MELPPTEVPNASEVGKIAFFFDRSRSLRLISFNAENLCPSATVVRVHDGALAEEWALIVDEVCYPRESEGICFHRRWFVCVSMCLSVTTMTKKIADGFVPNFMGRFLRGKGRPSSCFVTIGREM